MKTVFRKVFLPELSRHQGGTKVAPRSYEIGHRFRSQLSNCYSNFWDKIMKKVNFLDRSSSCDQKSKNLLTLNYSLWLTIEETIQGSILIEEILSWSHGVKSLWSRIQIFSWSSCEIFSSSWNHRFNYDDSNAISKCFCS